MPGSTAGHRGKAEQIDIEHPPDLRVLTLFVRRKIADAGVVHEHIDAAKVRLRRLHRRGDLDRSVTCSFCTSAFSLPANSVSARALRTITTNWTEMTDIKLSATRRLCKAAIPVMRARLWGNSQYISLIGGLYPNP